MEWNGRPHQSSVDLLIDSSDSFNVSDSSCMLTSEVQVLWTFFQTGESSTGTSLYVTGTPFMATILELFSQGGSGTLTLGVHRGVLVTVGLVVVPLCVMVSWSRSMADISPASVVGNIEDGFPSPLVIGVRTIVLGARGGAESTVLTASCCAMSLLTSILVTNPDTVPLVSSTSLSCVDFVKPPVSGSATFFVLFEDKSNGSMLYILPGPGGGALDWDGPDIGGENIRLLINVEPVRLVGPALS